MKNSIFLFLLLFSISTLSQDDRPLNAFFYGKKAIQNQEYDSAIVYFDSCVQAEPNETEYLFSLAHAYFKSEQEDASISILTKINRRKQGIADYELARCYAKKEMPDSAFYFLKSHLNSRYKKYESEIKLDPVINRLEKHEQWLPLWKEKWYSNYDHQLADIKYNISIKNYQLAQSILNEIFEKRSNPHEALYLSAILNKEQTFIHAALKDIELAMDKRKTIPEYHYLAAELLLELNKPSKALQRINMALDYDMYRLEYYRLKAIILNALKNYSDAIAYYNYYLKFTDFGYKELYTLSLMYYNEENNIRALKQINKALKMNKNSKDLYILRGKIYLASKLYKYAENDFTMSLDFDYQNGEVYFLRAKARFNQGKKEGACRDWQKARNLNIVDAEEFLKKHCLR